MATPNSKSSLKEYIKRKLGAPVLEINVDDDQFDDRIDEAIQYFQEYHYDGSIRVYLKHLITQTKKDGMLENETFTESSAGNQDYDDEQVLQQKNYIVLPDFVLAVNRIFPFHDKNNLNMFDLRYQLRLNDLYDLSSTNILHYEMVQQHLSLLDNILVGRTPVRYKQHMNRLYLDMDVKALTKDQYVIIECHRKIDPTDFTDIYNDMWLKRYATALVKYQWGENLSKFNGIALPGGVTMDASEMKSQAQEEITKLEEESRLNYELPVMDLMG